MSYDSQAWGDAATWASSILTGGSLLLGFSILRSDRKHSTAETAEGVSVWIEWYGMLGDHFDANPDVDTQYGQWVYVIETRNESSKAIRRPRIQVVNRGADPFKHDGFPPTHSPLSEEGLSGFRLDRSYMAFAPIEPIAYSSDTKAEVPFQDPKTPLKFGFSFASFMPPGAHWRTIIPLGQGELGSDAETLLMHFVDPRGREWVRNVRSGQLMRVRTRRVLYWNSSKRFRVAVSKRKKLKN